MGAGRGVLTIWAPPKQGSNSEHGHVQYATAATNLQCWLRKALAAFVATSTSSIGSWGLSYWI